MNDDFKNLLSEAVRFHGHLCGGQIIGVRIAMAGLKELEIKDSRGTEGRDLVIFVETDRCVVDAIISVTGRTPGKRSIKMMDYGKTAATFVETRTGRAVRVSVRADHVEKVQQLKEPHIEKKGEKQANLEALIVIPEKDLLSIERVRVKMRPQDLPGEPTDTVTCARCGETVRDMRQVDVDGHLLCKPCAQGVDYYTSHREPK
jgi:formylmethanofuran dehydrogenase subunit E